MTEDLTIPLIRATQKGRRNAALGILSTIISVLASVLIHVLNMDRAEADKNRLAAQAVAEKVTMESAIASLKFELIEKINALDKKVDHVETLLEERTASKAKK